MDGPYMDSTGTRGADCDIEATYGRTNAGEGTPWIVGAGVPADGRCPRTWTLPASKAWMSPSYCLLKSYDSSATWFLASSASFTGLSFSCCAANFSVVFLCRFSTHNWNQPASCFIITASWWGALPAALKRPHRCSHGLPYYIKHSLRVQSPYTKSCNFLRFFPKSQMHIIIWKWGKIKNREKKENGKKIKKIKKCMHISKESTWHVYCIVVV
jgi:hypothetical protein